MPGLLPAAFLLGTGAGIGIGIFVVSNWDDILEKWEDFKGNWEDFVTTFREIHAKRAMKVQERCTSTVDSAKDVDMDAVDEFRHFPKNHCAENESLSREIDDERGHSAPRRRELTVPRDVSSMDSGGDDSECISGEEYSSYEEICK